MSFYYLHFCQIAIVNDHLQYHYLNIFYEIRNFVIESKTQDLQHEYNRYLTWKHPFVVW